MIKLKRLGFTAIWISLILSSFLNIFLYSQLRKYYTLIYAIELDPLGLSFFQNSADQPKTNDNLATVVFFGDSRAAQWPNPNLPEFRFINRAIGNQTSAQVKSRFDEHVKPVQPDIVIIQVGINDLKTIPLFPERKQEIISNCESNIQGIIDDSLELGSEVIITTIFPAGKIPFYRRLVWSDDINKAIDEVNDYIRTLSQNHIIVFDAATVLSDENGQMMQEYSVDELHLNEEGYASLNVALTKILRRLR